MIHLAETYLSSDPPDPSKIALCEMAISGALELGLKSNQRDAPGGVVIGTAGTLTTLASMDLGLREYDSERIHGHHLSRIALERIFIETSRSSRRAISEMRGMEPGREDVILSGILIVKVIMDHLNAHELVISDWGLLEGVIVDLNPFDQGGMEYHGNRIHRGIDL